MEWNTGVAPWGELSQLGKSHALVEMDFQCVLAPEAPLPQLRNLSEHSALLFPLLIWGLLIPSWSHKLMVVILSTPPVTCVKQNPGSKPMALTPYIELLVPSQRRKGVSTIFPMGSPTPSIWIIVSNWVHPLIVAQEHRYPVPISFPIDFFPRLYILRSSGITALGWCLDLREGLGDSSVSHCASEMVTVPVALKVGVVLHLLFLMKQWENLTKGELGGRGGGRRRYGGNVPCGNSP